MSNHISFMQALNYDKHSINNLLKSLSYRRQSYDNQQVDDLLNDIYKAYSTSNFYQDGMPSEQADDFVINAFNLYVQGHIYTGKSLSHLIRKQLTKPSPSYHQKAYHHDLKIIEDDNYYTMNLKHPTTLRHANLRDVCHLLGKIRYAIQHFWSMQFKLQDAKRISKRLNPLFKGVKEI